MLDARIVKQLGAFSLDIDLQCRSDVTGIFGPSGSGKTTLLHCLSGVAVPDAGRIVCDGETWFDESKQAAPVSPPRRRVGYVFQESLLFPHMSVRENLRYGLRDRPALSLDEVAALLEIASLLDRRPDEISGGEARRVAIGRAILSNPRLLLFDEPLTGLDAALGARVLAGLRRVLVRCRIPALYVSHTVSDLLFLADEVILLRGGRAVGRGAARPTLLAPGVLSEAAMDEVRNIFVAPVISTDGGGTSKTAVCRVGNTELVIFAPPSAARSDAAGASFALTIRAADIVLARDRPVGLSARNIFSGTVQSVSGEGEKRLVLVDAGAPWLVEVSASSERELGLSPGATVHLIVKTSSIGVC